MTSFRLARFNSQDHKSLATLVGMVGTCIPPATQRDYSSQGLGNNRQERLTAQLRQSRFLGNAAQSTIRERTYRSRNVCRRCNTIREHLPSRKLRCEKSQLRLGRIVRQPMQNAYLQPEKQSSGPGTNAGVVLVGPSISPSPVPPLTECRASPSPFLQLVLVTHGGFAAE
jgi:hypothetical protein